MDRCALCPRVNACIPPHGPLRSSQGCLFIGEAPGKDEDREARKSPPGIPFIGRTGDEVNRHYLPLAGLTRVESTFHNAISCLPISAGGKLDPKRAKDLELLQSCAGARLYPLIERMRPRALVPLGAFACRAIFGESFDLELRHGIPTTSPWGIPTFPMYHPALGMYEPKKMLYIRNDWYRLGQWLKGKLYVPEDPYPTPDYAEILTASDLEDLDPQRPLAGDTESSREGPFCLTISQSPGTGRLIRSERVDLLKTLDERVQAWEAPILFHNWIYDWPVTEAMGLHLPVQRIRDTMAYVYALGNLPQGLKALGLRELGMEMQDFEDLVAPHSRREILHYYWEAQAIRWPKPEASLVYQADGTLKLYQPQSLNTRLKRFFTDLKKNPEKNVFDMWENWEDMHEAVEQAIGPWPGMDIRHAPFDEVLRYACRDADATLRLWLDVIVPRLRVVRRGPQEKWGEYAA